MNKLLQEIMEHPWMFFAAEDGFVSMDILERMLDAREKRDAAATPIADGISRPEA